jgi:hypothetical protein
MINFNLFDFDSIFGVIKSTEKLTRNQVRTLRTEIQERAIAKYSGGQLFYVGDTEDGKDFIGIFDNLRYESKGINGMFQKKVPYTKEIILKNFRGNQTQIEQTFDYMFLWDTKNYKMGISPWESCYKNAIVKDANICSKILHEDISIVIENISPIEKTDFNEELNKLIEEII